jgi:hypothetical protein
MFPVTSSVRAYSYEQWHVLSCLRRNGNIKVVHLYDA